MRRFLLSFFILTIFILPAQGVKADPVGPRVKYQGVLPDAFYDALAQCETGGNWNHSTKSYTGGLGIYRGTWRWFSTSRSATGKTARQQVEIADRIAFKGHHENGTFRKPVGVFGWGCVKHHKYISKYVCQSKLAIVKRFKTRC